MSYNGNEFRANGAVFRNRSDGYNEFRANGVVFKNRPDGSNEVIINGATVFKNIPGSGEFNAGDVVFKNTPRGTVIVNKSQHKPKKSSVLSSYSWCKSSGGSASTVRSSSSCSSISWNVSSYIHRH